MGPQIVVRDLRRIYTTFVLGTALQNSGTRANRFGPRENEVREHIPVPHDNLFQSILSFSQLFLV